MSRISAVAFILAVALMGCGDQQATNPNPADAGTKEPEQKVYVCYDQSEVEVKEDCPAVPTLEKPEIVLSYTGTEFTDTTFSVAVIFTPLHTRGFYDFTIDCADSNEVSIYHTKYSDLFQGGVLSLISLRYAPYSYHCIATGYAVETGNQWAEGMINISSTPLPSPIGVTDTCSDELALVLTNSAWTVPTVVAGAGETVVGKFTIDPGDFGAYIGRMEFQIEGDMIGLDQQFFKVYDRNGNEVAANVPPSHSGAIDVPFITRHSVAGASEELTLKIYQIPAETSVGTLRVRLTKIEYITGWGDACIQSGDYDFAWDTNISLP